MEKIEENKFYEECPECKGCGTIKVHFRNSCTTFRCDLCNGRGKIDWIDKIKKGTKLPDGVYRRFASIGFEEIFYKEQGEWRVRLI